MGALGDGDEHDVHHPDAAHDQRDAADAAQERVSVPVMELAVFNISWALVMVKSSVVTLCRVSRIFLTSPVAAVTVLAWVACTVMESIPFTSPRRERRVCTVGQRDDDVVIGGAQAAAAFAGEHADHLEGMPWMRMLLPTIPVVAPNRVVAAEEPSTATSNGR